MKAVFWLRWAPALRTLGVMAVAVSLLLPPAAVEGEQPLRTGARLTGWLEPLVSDSLVDPVSEKGQTAQGLYFNGPTMRRLGADGIIRSVERGRMNAAVIDLKDGQGRIMWDSEIPELQAQKRGFVSDMPALVASLRQAGIYVIGRIVCFSDPQLPVRYPDRAVLDARPNRKGRIWANGGRRNPWLDPYNRANHDLVLGMAKEAEALGIDEIQFDYFRFPVDEATPFATFPAAVDTPRREVLLGLLKRVDQAVRIPLGVDVFGLTAFRSGDKTGLGQSLEDWAQHLEVFSPMLYVNGMGNWMRDGKPKRALRLVNVGVKLMRERLGYGPVIRPFLQAFPAGADYYNAEFITEQIRGARGGGADGFLFWHPASNYGTVRQAMRGLARALTPFPIAERQAWRRQSWSDRLMLPRQAAVRPTLPAKHYLQ
ncbi:MAG: hypothetical protein OXU20_28210 [Myxococcales bacterium]|nr:hypothetical protein [Myxococcales bacterium]